MEIDVPFFVKPFEDHYKIKNSLLSILDEQEFISYKDDSDSITKTDWHTNTHEAKEYWKFLYPKIFPIIKGFIEDDLLIGIKSYDEHKIVNNYWFQQYYKKDNHGWHRHLYCSFNAIYYVELPEKTLLTEFRSPSNSKTYTINANEGDIVFFPSFLIHRSPTNETYKRKTVIAFNLI